MVASTVYFFENKKRYNKFSSIYIYPCETKDWCEFRVASFVILKIQLRKARSFKSSPKKSHSLRPQIPLMLMSLATSSEFHRSFLLNFFTFFFYFFNMEYPYFAHLVNKSKKIMLLINKKISKWFHSVFFSLNKNIYIYHRAFNINKLYEVLHLQYVF